MSLHRAMLVFERTGEDVAVTSCDFISPEPWPAGGSQTYAAVSALFDTWWTNVRDKMPSSVTLREVRYYREDDETPPWGDVALIHTVNLAGQDNIGACPPQTAMSVTKEHGLRKHWGRMYLPAPGKQFLNANGRFNNAVIDDVAIATEALLDGLATGPLWQPVVYCNVGGNPAIIEITHIRVDDIPDVIRRRRAEGVGYSQRRAITDATP